MLYALLNLLRYLITGIDLIVATLILYGLAFLPRRLTRAWYPWLFQRWCWLFIHALGVKLHVHQKNQDPLPTRFIVIGNHPSAFEDIGLPALFRAHFLAKAEIKQWWLLGRISTAAGTLYVQRESKASRQEAAAELINHLQQGKNIGLYPEGGCHGRRLSLPFRYGAFDAAIKSKTAIIPVFLHYEAQEAFEWKPHESLLQKIWAILWSPNKTVHYYIYDAIDPSQFTDKAMLCNHVETCYQRWQAHYLL